MFFYFIVRLNCVRITQASRLHFFFFFFGNSTQEQTEEVRIIEWCIIGKDQPIFAVPNSLPTFVELVGGGGFSICD